MNIGYQILFSFSALGALNGLILCLYLFLNKRKKSVSALLLGTLLLLFSIRVGKSVLLYFNPDLPRIYLQIGLSTCFLVGPLLFFYIKTIQDKVVKVPTAWKIHGLILLAIVVVGGVILPYESNVDLWNVVIVRILYLQWGIYLLATGYLMSDTLKAGFTSFSDQSPAHKFQIVLWLGNMVIFMIYVLTLFNLIKGMYIIGPVSFSLIFYLVLSFCLKGNTWAIISPETEAPKSEKKRIASANAEIWLEQLNEFMLKNERFKDPNLKLIDLAQAISVTPHQLSQLLNENLGKSCSTYINEYRIEAACKLIMNASPLSFEALGYEVGYNSKSTFYTVFKKITGHTPSSYKDISGVA
ncbi:AraC family transcriptional regulator [Chitinophaga silvatica]|uniref:AraC family transcriptional regulator n=1 Tax=Chitinophaga silvatica TaxID=2282649 RepID=A0A3E1YHX1_9BACT|nr:helix-turn-helix domain-containing protein [Chitinophaga silvatica]RFS26956.1 AraC family transcriptional regulator [Chitinophaga silvatica]